MYEAHFGLAELPFRIAPDPRFYVDARPHRMAIRGLLDGLRRGDEFTPLIGDFGTGKTTVARRMLEEAEAARHVVAELSHVRVAGDELLDRIAEALGMRRPKATPPMGVLIPQFEALARDGRDAWLLVDEADSLNVGALNRLRKLTSVRVDGRAALHVFLVGRSMPAAIEELRRVGRPLKIGAPVRMEPLDAASTHEYILERLRRAGGAGRPVFDARTTAEIHARCQGTPGRINRLCGRILLHLYMQGRHEIDLEVVCEVDELLQFELSGEPAAFAPPPALQTPPSPPIATPIPIPRAERPPPVLSTESRDLDLDIEVPPAPPIRMAAAPRRPAPARLPVPVAAARPAVRARSPQRRGLPRGVSAVALLISGGVLWQAISHVATAYTDRARSEALATAFSRQEAAAAAHDAAPLAGALPVLATPASQAASTNVPMSPLPATSDMLATAERAIVEAPPGAGQAPAVGVAGHDARARQALPLRKTQTASAIKGARHPAATATCYGPTDQVPRDCADVPAPAPATQ